MSARSTTQMLYIDSGTVFLFIKFVNCLLVDCSFKRHHNIFKIYQHKLDHDRTTTIVQLFSENLLNKKSFFKSFHFFIGVDITYIYDMKD